MEPIASERVNSAGDRSEFASTSTIFKRCGSASAAWIAALRAIDLSIVIEAMMIEHR